MKAECHISFVEVVLKKPGGVGFILLLQLDNGTVQMKVSIAYFIHIRLN